MTARDGRLMLDVGLCHDDSPYIHDNTLKCRLAFDCPVGSPLFLFFVVIFLDLILN